MPEYYSYLVLSWIIFSIFMASLIRSSAGFGDSLIAMPLLLVALPLEEAVVVTSSMGAVIGALLVYKNLKYIIQDYKEPSLLVLGSLIGIPIGAQLLFLPFRNYIILGFSLYLMAVSARSFLNIKIPHLPDQKEHLMRMVPLL